MRHVRHRFALVSFAVFLLGSTALPTIAGASSPQTHGLLITPLRQYLKVTANTATKSSLTVSNLTNKPLNIHLSVQQFSLTDYTYNYRFTQPANNWLRIETPDITLEPSHTQIVTYELSVPAGITPGGYYYTLLASANLASQGIDSTIQAADLLYLTVSGKLTYTSRLQTSSVSHFSFGRPFAYHLNAVDTGNIYFFAYTTGALHGWSARPVTTSTAHMLVPDTVRSLSGEIAAPILPGIYTATYGYRTDNDQHIVRKSLVVFIPPWSVAFLLVLLLIVGKLLNKRHSRKEHQSSLL
ncbi:MAG TPA: hypothetical protein VLG92_00540 [Candidatus Saccharimonadia bacterium]|nr:hypothetical protein [Candidatus Saccharimonadia bacterium]